MVQPLSRGGQPRSIAVLHPIPWPQQNDASGLHEEHAKVAIAAFGDAPQDRSITCLGTKPSHAANRGDDGARDDRTYARYWHQMLTRLRGLGRVFDFATHGLDAIV